MPARHLVLRALPAALALVGLLPATGGAAVHSWTGAASANWSDAANWAGGLPVAGGTTLDVSRLYTDGVISVTAVPEPGQWALMLGGLGLLARFGRRTTTQA